jgi:hypothetical protein
MAAMTMPEAAMDKDGRPIFRKNKIRLARQLPGMQAVPKSARMQAPPDQPLWFGVLSPDARHHPAACHLVDDIDHQATSNRSW